MLTEEAAVESPESLREGMEAPCLSPEANGRYKDELIF